MPPDDSAAAQDVSNLERLGALVRSERDLRGWNQYDLGRAAGIGRATVQRVEAGRPAESETLRAIFSALKLDFREIPVALGLVTREEMGLPPAPVRRFSASTETLIGLLEDPDMSDEERLALVDLLRARRAKPTAKSTPKPEPRRHAG